MSLFDDNFVVSMEAEEAKAKEAEAKEAKDDEKAEDADADAPAEDDAKDEGEGKEAKTECKEDNDAEDPEEGDDDDDVEVEEESLSEYDIARVNEAVEADIEADSVEEATGFDRILASEAEEVNYACLEAVSANIAFDQCDIVCTEAYVTATSQYEKDAVTENFKESVKKFGARFKAFLVKIKNAIVRIANKAINYVKVLVSKVSAKFASKVKLPSKIDIADDVKIRVIKAMVYANSFRGFANKVFYAESNDAFDKIVKAINSLKDKSADYVRQYELDTVKLPEVAELVGYGLGQGRGKGNAEGFEDIKLAQFASSGASLLKDLSGSGINEAIDVIKDRRKKMEDSLKQAENAVKSMNDIASDKINVLTACVNKAMVVFNRTMSACIKLLTMWVNQKVRVVRALAKHAGTGISTEAAANVQAVKSGSANLFENFLSMI